jgi:hypothetical protein
MKPPTRTCKRWCRRHESDDEGTEYCEAATRWVDDKGYATLKHNTDEGTIIVVNDPARGLIYEIGTYTLDDAEAYAKAMLRQVRRGRRAERLARIMRSRRPHATRSSYSPQVNAVRPS